MYANCTLQLKLNNFSSLLIQQIDTMSDVAEAFSDFATFPKTKMKNADLVEVTQKAVNIFDQEHIVFSTDKANIFHKLDRTQWILSLIHI